MMHISLKQRKLSFDIYKNQKVNTRTFFNLIYNL
jgi:hypothetical protein